MKEFKKKKKRKKCLSIHTKGQPVCKDELELGWNLCWKRYEKTHTYTTQAGLKPPLEK